MENPQLHTLSGSCRRVPSRERGQSPSRGAPGRGWQQLSSHSSPEQPQARDWEVAAKGSGRLSRGSSVTLGSSTGLEETAVASVSPWALMTGNGAKTSPFNLGQGRSRKPALHTLASPPSPFPTGLHLTQRAREQAAWVHGARQECRVDSRPALAHSRSIAGDWDLQGQSSSTED